MISKEHFSTLVKNKDHFYKAMVANGYFMPSKASPFCTLKIMKEMYDGTCYCPMTLDTRLEPCLHPPSCEQLVDMFGLLPSEARLAWLLAQATSIRDAAAALGLSEETARNYSKKIYAKTGASGHAELVRVIMTSVLALS